MFSRTNIPIIIVGYRNAEDIVECLAALQTLVPDPKYDVYICENGGAAAFDTLVSALVGGHGPCVPFVSPPQLPTTEQRFVRVRTLVLHGVDALVTVAEANSNLGYAGGINPWLRVLKEVSGWPGVWILNPDTQPDSRALAELVSWSNLRKRGMVGSRIVRTDRPDLTHSRGLRWRCLLSSAEAVDYLAPAAIEPDADAVERRIDAPSGASIYVTRTCLDNIGPMDEQYFLYFEDLDWGCRAKEACGVGYAYNSIVRHRVGTTIGTTRGDRSGSRLSIYLEFRNSIHFIRKYHYGWLGWSLAILALRSLEYGIRGEFRNMQTAFSGLIAGWAGKSGRPDFILETNDR